MIVVVFSFKAYDYIQRKYTLKFVKIQNLLKKISEENITNKNNFK